MVHQPHRDLGDARRPLADLDAVKCIDVDQREKLNVQLLLLAAMERLEDLDLELAQLPVRNDKEVAAAAGRVEETQLREFLLEAPQLGFVLADLSEFLLQVVEEEGADDLEDVAFAGVVRTDLPPLARFHDRLEQGAEDHGRNPRPVEACCGKQRVAHVAVEVGEGLFAVLLALLGRRVQNVEKLRQVYPKVGAILDGAVDDV